MRLSLGNYLNDTVVRFYHQLYRAPNSSFSGRRTRYMDSYILLWPSADINKFIENGGDGMDRVVATKTYKSYYDSTRESYHTLWLIHQMYYDVTLSWQHFKLQYAAKALHELLGHNARLDIDCGGRIILILRKPTIKDRIYNYYDNITSYKRDADPYSSNTNPNEPKNITLKLINENTNYESFLDFNLTKYQRRSEYQKYECQVYVLHTPINRTTFSHCQQSNNHCHWI